MRITELAKHLGTTEHQIRYLERKGYIEPNWILLESRRVRQYPDSEVLKTELIVKYLSQGFRYDIAYQKAKDELRRPRLV